VVSVFISKVRIHVKFEYQYPLANKTTDWLNSQPVM
jgi:hypothetical protein